jgi:LysR family transcriptional activator of mexEF-oprN operon
VRVYLQKLVESAFEPASFDPMTSTRTIRLGLSDGAQMWLLPRLLRVLEREAPGIRMVVQSVQFRSVGSVLASGAVDIALTVADDLPPSVVRKPVVESRFVCLRDPRFARFRTLTEKSYFDHDHVIVSYNGDLRGVIEETLGKTRSVRCSVPSFPHIGMLIEGTALLATVPEILADAIVALQRKLAKVSLPFRLPIVPEEMLWPFATDDDDACRFVRAKIEEVAGTLPLGRDRRRHGA